MVVVCSNGHIIRVTCWLHSITEVDLLWPWCRLANKHFVCLYQLNCPFTFHYTSIYPYTHEELLNITDGNGLFVLQYVFYKQFSSFWTCLFNSFYKFLLKCKHCINFKYVLIPDALLADLQNSINPGARVGSPGRTGSPGGRTTSPGRTGSPLGRGGSPGRLSSQGSLSSPTSTGYGSINGTRNISSDYAKPGSVSLFLKVTVLWC